MNILVVINIVLIGGSESRALPDLTTLARSMIPATKAIVNSGLTEELFKTLKPGSGNH